MSVLRNSARHFKAFFLAFAFLLFAFNFAFAATSESYAISAEVIDLGGGM